MKDNEFIDLDDTNVDILAEADARKKIQEAVFAQSWEEIEAQREEENRARREARQENRQEAKRPVREPKKSKTSKTSKNKSSKTKTNKAKLTKGKIVGRVFAVIGITVAAVLIFALAILFVLLKGPSKEARRLFTLSAYETSAIKWVPRIYLSGKEYDEIINPPPKHDTFEQLPTAQLSMLDKEDVSFEVSEEELASLEIVDIKGATYQGKLMIIRDPKRVSFVSLDAFGGRGLTLSQFIDKYDAIGCTNAGGFEDEGGQGKGGIPDGVVIRDGKIIYGSAGSHYRGVAGFDADGILHVGDMTGQQALDCGILDGTNFANGPVLIKDGIRNSDYVSGINPRTGIGQTPDGTVLLLAIEGRLADSLGATFEDMTDIFEEYGAVNAVNMDGGSSSGMYYEGERITRSCSLVGDRPIPTAIVVSR